MEQESLEQKPKAKRTKKEKRTVQNCLNEIQEILQEPQAVLPANGTRFAACLADGDKLIPTGTMLVEEAQSYIQASKLTWGITIDDDVTCVLFVGVSSGHE